MYTELVTVPVEAPIRESRNSPGALVTTGRSGVVGQYAVLFGAAIAAKGIVNQQVSNNPSAKSQAGSPSPGDLVNDDAGNTDLGDLQYVLFNLVALVYVVGSVYVSPLHGLPKIPDVLLGLTSVSAAGYVGKKAFTPRASRVRRLCPTTAHRAQRSRFRSLG
jgi:hypothetical protein